MSFFLSHRFVVAEAKMSSMFAPAFFFLPAPDVPKSKSKSLFFFFDGSNRSAIFVLTYTNTNANIKKFQMVQL